MANVVLTTGDIVANVGVVENVSIKELAEIVKSSVWFNGEGFHGV